MSQNHYIQRQQIYLDHNATTPVADSVRLQVLDWLQHWGNPSSIHQTGRGPKNLLRESRKTVANFLSVHPLEIIFTSGGSESNNQAIKGVFQAAVNGALDLKGVGDRRKIIASSVEHPSVINTLKALEKVGAEVHFIQVNREGEFDFDQFDQLCDEKTLLVSCMYANNETGHVLPIKKITERAHQVGALVHCDAVQALGKANIDLKDWDVDYASLSSHKFYALKGSGLLYQKKGCLLESLIDGGAQERKRRAGTENLLAIASLAHMCSRANEIPGQIDRIKKLRDQMECRILEQIDHVKINGQKGDRLPNTSSMLIPGVDGESLLMNLDIEGFSVSTGAACSSGSPEPSPVLLAMGLSRQEAQSSLRIGLGWGTTEAEIKAFVEALQRIVARLRALNPRTEEENEPGKSYIPGSS